MHEHKEKLAAISTEITHALGKIGLDGLSAQIADLTAETEKPDFWSDTEKAQAISKHLAGLKKELESPDKTVESLKAAMEALNQAAYKLAEIIYKQSQAQGQQAGPGAESAGPSQAGPEAGADSGPEEKKEGEGPVIDAEFKEK